MKNGPYELIKPPANYPGKRYRGRYAYEHHVVFWLSTGICAPKGYEIHHLNGDHRDNRIKNLKLVTSEEHKAIHSALRHLDSRVVATCGFCKQIFFMSRRDYKRRFAQSASGRLYCCRSHQVRGQKASTQLLVPTSVNR